MLLKRMPKEFPKKTRIIRADKKRKNISAVLRNPTAQNTMREKSMGMVSWKGISTKLLVK